MENCNQLYLVIGGELTEVGGCIEFRDPAKIDFVGAFGDRQKARDAWKGKAQLTVDNAHMRYFILPVQGLLA